MTNPIAVSQQRRRILARQICAWARSTSLSAKDAEDFGCDAIDAFEAEIRAGERERAAIVAVTEADREAAERLEETEWPGNHGAWSHIVAEHFARHRATHAGEVERLREALRPFATFAEPFVGDDGWIGPMNKERIVDWFGPSDFSIARQALEASR